MKAFYDSKPAILEEVGNGSSIYRFDFEAVDVQISEQEHKTQWKCEEVVVWSPLTANKITEAVITDKFDNNREQKLINDFNSAQLGVFGERGSETAQRYVTNYTEYLKERVRLKSVVDADCKKLGIE